MKITEKLPADSKHAKMLSEKKEAKPEINKRIIKKSKGK